MYQNGGGTIVSEVVEHADDTGLVTLSLPANSTLIPDNSFFRLEVKGPADRKAKVAYIQVPNGAGPYDVEDVLHEPGEVDESALAAHIATIKTHADWSDTSPSAGQVPIWDGSNWTPGDTVATDIEANALVVAHSALTTGVHGVGASTVESASGAQTKATAAQAAAEATAAADATTKANQALADAEPYPVAPLLIPTYDDDLSVTHPDVVYFPEKWNGYRYWMAFTPYPGGTRENPSIVVSNDGINWEEPPGLTNPVSPRSEALGDSPTYLYFSDTDLVYDEDNDRLIMFYRAYDDGNNPTPRERIYQKTSTDGVTWSAKTNLVTLSGSLSLAMSPAVIVEDNGTFTMWSVNRTLAATAMVERRTSADAATWSAASSCTIPAGYDAWHLDVAKVGSVYYMLLNTLSGGNATYLYLLKSTDGITWTSPTVVKPVPKSGLAFDAARQYRSSLVPVPGDPLRFDIFLSGLPTGFRTSGPETGNDWRIGLLKNYQLDIKQHDNDYHSDGPYVIGAAYQQRIRSGRMISTFCHNMGTAVVVDGRLQASPIFLANAAAIASLRCEVVTTPASAGGLVHLGLYADDGTGYPGALLVDAGTVDVTSTGVKIATISYTPPRPGLYWVAAVPQGAPATNPTLRVHGGRAPGLPHSSITNFATLINGWRIASGVTSGMPNPFPTTGMDLTDATPCVGVVGA